MPATSRYAICIDNTDFPASLEVRKIYEILPPDLDDEPGLIRVVDESGEDYLLPSEKFVAIDLPVEATAAFRP